jgi:beta-N-acetylhexosaminidase
MTARLFATPLAAALLCAWGGAPAAPAAPASSAESRSAAASTPAAATCVALSRWSNRRLAALTVVVPVQESDVTGVAREVARGAGGVILFGSSAPANLGSRLAVLRNSVPGHLGLYVMTDEEGGGIERMANLVGHLPWARYMGQHWSTGTITSHVATMAHHMAAVGADTDLAPVVDVDGRNVPPGPTDPDGWRSFSGRTSVVSRDGVAYFRGLRQGGVIAVLKHFPGLGGASGNTDNGAAHTLPWSKLRTVALPPFIAGINAGAPAVMISNATVPGLTTEPASLSRAVITGQLVQQLHFHGLVITDSLSAGAISQAGFSVRRAAVYAIRAGADLVLYNAAGPSAAASMFDGIITSELSAVSHGTLARSRLLAAARATLSTRHVAVCS